jgi:hypothetical protein
MHKCMEYVRLTKTLCLCLNDDVQGSTILIVSYNCGGRLLEGKSRGYQLLVDISHVRI